MAQQTLDPPGTTTAVRHKMRVIAYVDCTVGSVSYRGCLARTQDANGVTRHVAVRFRIPGDMYRDMIRHLREALPNEGCALIGVDAEAGDDARAVALYLGSNIDLSPVRFTMDPGETVRAFRDMRERGLRLGAIVHSHPRTPATPSPTDLRESFYPDAVFAIVSFAGAEPDLRGWCLAGVTDPDDAVPVEIVIELG